MTCGRPHIYLLAEFDLDRGPTLIFCQRARSFEARPLRRYILQTQNLGRLLFPPADLGVIRVIVLVLWIGRWRIETAPITIWDPDRYQRNAYSFALGHASHCRNMDPGIRGLDNLWTPQVLWYCAQEARRWELENQGISKPITSDLKSRITRLPLGCSRIPVKCQPFGHRRPRLGLRFSPRPRWPRGIDLGELDPAFRAKPHQVPYKLVELDFAKLAERLDLLSLKFLTNINGPKTISEICKRATIDLQLGLKVATQLAFLKIIFLGDVICRDNVYRYCRRRLLWLLRNPHTVRVTLGWFTDIRHVKREHVKITLLAIRDSLATKLYFIADDLIDIIAGDNFIQTICPSIVNLLVILHMCGVLERIYEAPVVAGVYSPNKILSNSAELHNKSGLLSEMADGTHSLDEIASYIWCGAVGTDFSESFMRAKLSAISGIGSSVKVVPFVYPYRIFGHQISSDFV